MGLTGGDSGDDTTGRARWIAPVAWPTSWSAGWWLAALALAWLAGVAGQLQQAALWPVATYQALTLAGSLGLLLAATGLGRRVCGRLAGAAALCAVLLAVPSLAALGWGSTGWRADARLSQRLPPALEGLDLVVTGVVTGLPQRDATGTRFLFEVEAAQAGGRALPLHGRLSLGWYAGFDDIAWLDAPAAELRPGQRWQLPLRLKQPHGLMNPGGFHMELRWFEQGVVAQGHVRLVRGGPAAQQVGDASGHALDRLRDSVRSAIWRQVPDARVAGVLAALVVGDQSAIGRSDWELFRQTGIAHLVSISGVHVTMFAWLAAGVLGWAWRRWPRGLLWVPPHPWPAAGAACCWPRPMPRWPAGAFRPSAPC
jgi:competence protein ComEC